MKRFLAPLFLLVLACATAYSAATDTISGTVIDSVSSLAINQVKVRIVGDVFKDSCFTDSLGKFIFTTPIPTGNMLGGKAFQAKTFLRLNNGNFQWQSVSGEASIEMVNLQGKKIYEASAKTGAGSFRIPNLAAGLYLIKFRTAEQTDVFRYLHQGGIKGSLSVQAEVLLSLSALAKRAATGGFTLTFDKIPYMLDTVKITTIQSCLKVRLRIPPNSAYQLYGMNFSPYIDGQDPNTGVFVPEQQIIDRMRIIAPYTKSIRTFSTTHGLNVCGRIAHQFGLKAYIGAWIGPDTAVNNQELDSLIAMAKRGEVDTAIVGSEAMLRGDVTEAKLIELIGRFRTALPKIPVTTADVYGQLQTRPNLIAACDFLYGNFYPYWEGSKVDYAVASLNNSYQNLVKVAGGKDVLVSEAGWPSAGDAFGDAVPSPENASYYLLDMVSWARANKVKIFDFEAFDESWKTSEGAVGPNWGIFDKNGVMKPGMQKVFDGDTLPNNWIGSDTVGGPGTPEIDFTFVPAMGSYDNLQGKVLHVVPKDYGLAVYIKVSGGWWQKPTWASPVTIINADGTWICDVTTGGYDNQATEFKVFLIPASYVPPADINAIAPDQVVATQDTVRS